MNILDSMIYAGISGSEAALSHTTALHCNYWREAISFLKRDERERTAPYTRGTFFAQGFQFVLLQTFSDFTKLYYTVISVSDFTDTFHSHH